MMLLEDMWLLATRRITMFALAVVFGLVMWHWPFTGLMYVALWFHASGGIISGDLLLRKTRGGKSVWLWTLAVYGLILAIGIVMVLFDPSSSKTPDVFDYKDVLQLIFGIIAGSYMVFVSAWAAAPELSYEEVASSFFESCDRESMPPLVGIGALYSVSTSVDGYGWLIGLVYLAACAWVLRFMLGTPPERKAKAFKTAEGAA